MSITYKIKGGKSLHGSVSVKGSPLAAVGSMAAGLLTTDKVTLTNVPHLFDLDVLIEELRQLGVMADWTHPHEMTLLASLVNPELKISESNLIGWSPVLLGALVIRSNRLEMEATEIDMLDDRLATTVSLLKQFGGTAEWYEGKLQLSLHHIHGAEIFLDRSSAEQTLLAVLFAATANGETIIEGAVIDPEIEDVFACLSSMGAVIDRQDDARLRIVGSTQLHGTTHNLIPDRYEAGLFAALAIISDGDILIKDIKPAIMMSFLSKVQQLGASYQVGSDGIRFWVDHVGAFRPIDLTVKPYPGIGKDWLALFLPILCQADGESVLETDSPEELSGALRLLQGLGGEVHLHYGLARVFGPSKLVASRIEADGFITAMTGLIAAIGSNGVTELSGVDGIDGRFETLPERLVKLGAKIERIEN